ncbi:MAG: transglutaminase family protein [Gammaproteobacteria bacterium]|nr:transglutaminase family protein [Gammaproteobacteria bacterium]
MNYRVIHITEYEYSGTVGLCHNEARLKPRNLPHQTCLNSRVVVNPAPVDYHERTDFFGNIVSFFSVQQPHEKLTIIATSEVSISPERDLFGSGNNQSWEQVVKYLREVRSGEILDVLQYVMDSPMIVSNQELQEYASQSFQPGTPLIDAVNDLMRRIFHDFTYDSEFSTIATPLSDVLAHRRGVCQDFAHLAIACIRSLGLAARYVSGYIETLPPPGEKKLVGADASHAWFSVYFPEAGWIDFDPTNNQMPMDKHITVAWGRDFNDVTPLKGIAFGGGQHKLSVAVDVQSL